MPNSEGVEIGEGGGLETVVGLLISLLLKTNDSSNPCYGREGKRGSGKPLGNLQN